MRISIQACIEGEGSQPSKVITVGVVERHDSFAPAAGLGLFMRETHAMLKRLQTVVLDEQVDRFVARSARCLACGAPLGIKDTKRLSWPTMAWRPFSGPIGEKRIQPRMSWKESAHHVHVQGALKIGARF